MRGPSFFFVIALLVSVAPGCTKIEPPGVSTWDGVTMETSVLAKSSKRESVTPLPLTEDVETFRRKLSSVIEETYRNMDRGTSVVVSIRIKQGLGSKPNELTHISKEALGMPADGRADQAVTFGFCTVNRLSDGLYSASQPVQDMDGKKSDQLWVAPTDDVGRVTRYTIDRLWGPFAECVGLIHPPIAKRLSEFTPQGITWSHYNDRGTLPP